MYSTAELVILAKAYLEATGIAPSTLGTRVANNDKLFIRLIAGLDCTARNAERASRYFDETWPVWLPWPEEVRRRRRPRPPRPGSGGRAGRPESVV
jgi:hypothetical protein